MKLSEHLAIMIRSYKWMFQNERKYTLYLVVHTILTAAVAYIPLYYSTRIIDALFAGEPVKVIAGYVLLAVGIAFLMHLIADFIQPRLDSAFFRTYQEQDWSYSDKAMSMAYESLEDREVVLLRDRTRKESQTGFNLFFLHRTTKNMIFTLTQVICSLALTMSFFTNPQISVWMKWGFVILLAATIAVECICTLKSSKITNDFWDECILLNVFSEKFARYIENYSTGKDIRLYDMGQSLLRDMEKMDEEQHQKSVKRVKRQIKVNTPRVLMLEVLQCTTNLFLISAAIAGAVSVGSISKYVSSIVLMLGAITRLVTEIQLAFSNNKYLKRYFEYFDIPNNMYQGSLTVEKRDDNEYFVEFKDVSFQYPNTDTYALRHVNLKFKIGEKLAVVGMNGSGKTTFIKLMCRLYDPTEGEILLNGVNIKKYDYEEYMSIFSVVFQDFQLFAFSLGQNVAAGTKYDAKRVQECLTKAGFTGELPKGLETYLYKDYEADGIEISGGEAQKIALARALYKDAPFIILDEPTAALDPVSEYEVYSNFNRISGDKTAIYISHRLASCRFCDKIAVFHEGKLVQRGTHEELVSDKKGKYYELWNAQAQYYAE